MFINWYVNCFAQTSAIVSDEDDFTRGFNRHSGNYFSFRTDYNQNPCCKLKLPVGMLGVLDPEMTLSTMTVAGSWVPFDSERLKMTKMK